MEFCFTIVFIAPKHTRKKISDITKRNGPQPVFGAEKSGIRDEKSNVWWKISEEFGTVLWVSF